MTSSSTGATSVPPPLFRCPLLGGLSVTDLPVHRFAYSWGILAPTVHRLTSSPGSRVDHRRTVIEPGEECVVFLALVLGDDASDRRPAWVDLWDEDGDHLGRVPLRVLRPAGLEDEATFEP